MARYRDKSTGRTVEAVQVLPISYRPNPDGDSDFILDSDAFSERVGWLEVPMSEGEIGLGKDEDGNPAWGIMTRDEMLVAKPGDWIIKDGYHLNVFSDEAFRATFAVYELN